MSFTVSYDLPGYPRQHERGFSRVEDAEARGNALAEQGIATGISVSEGEELTAEAPPSGGTTKNIEVTVELPAEQPDEAAD
jgi:hypothetical protein